SDLGLDLGVLCKLFFIGRRKFLLFDEQSHIFSVLADLVEVVSSDGLIDRRVLFVLAGQLGGLVIITESLLLIAFSVIVDETDRIGQVADRIFLGHFVLEDTVHVLAGRILFRSRSTRFQLGKSELGILKRFVVELIVLVVRLIEADDAERNHK